MPFAKTLRPFSAPAGLGFRRLLICIALTLLTIAVYWPVRHFGFVSYDDYLYFSDNPYVQSGLNRSSIVWAFTTFETANYIPLTWLSLMAHASVFGTGPQGLHVENVALHAINVMLLFLLLVNTTADFWPSAIVAALFAVHPTHVESVAWISERKDVLYMLFFLLAMHSYVVYAASERRASQMAYVATLVLLVCGLLSKSMLVTFPFILLLVDYWPLRRLSGTAPATVGRFPSITLLRGITEKIPFLVLCLGMTVLEYRAQSTITASLQEIPLSLRAENAVVSYNAYLAKSLWPSNLSVLYPYRWQIPISSAVCGLAVLTAVTLLVFMPAHNRQIRGVGWLWFLGTLVPVIGVVQVGAQCMADRYLYLPSIGLTALVVWGLRPLATRAGKSSVAIATITLIFALSVLTRRQVGYWIDSDHLFSHASVVLNGFGGEEIRLGMLAAQRGDLPAAQQHYQAALAADPSNYAADFNLGNLLLASNPALAIQHYRAAAVKQPRVTEVQINWGVALMRLNDPANAFSHFHTAELLDPSSYDAHYNLARLFLSAGKLPDARAEFTLALQARPNDVRALQGLRSSQSLN